MSIQETLSNARDALPVERQQEVLDFAEFLSMKQVQRDWQQSGLKHFARCYGPEEPDYGDLPGQSNRRS